MLSMLPTLLIKVVLGRMLLAFSEQAKGQKLPDNVSDQEMLEIVMARYQVLHFAPNYAGSMWFILLFVVCL